MRLVAMTLIVTLLLPGVCSAGPDTAAATSNVYRRPSQQRRHLRRQQHKLRRTMLKTQGEHDTSMQNYQGPEALPTTTPLLLDMQSTVLFPDTEARLLETKNRYSGNTSKRHSKLICCPYVETTVHPVSGIRRDGSSARLYRTKDFTPSFQERMCADPSDEQMARVRRVLRRRFSCFQEHSYTYAVFYLNGSVVVDSMRIASGCSCELHRPRLKKKGHRRKAHKKH